MDQGQSFIAGYIDNEDLEIKLPGPVIVFGDHTSALKYIDFNFVAGADGVKILRPICYDERYFYLAAKTLPIENRGYGRHYSRLTDNLFPLPPFEEQHRIVAKVDELMTLCDQLEQQQADSIETHKTLVETLLGALTRVENEKAFSETWQRIADHFDTLFTTEHSIDQLKQTILQLAVIGKLVPQDPRDEPANLLLEKISEEKAQLVKDAQIKKQKLLPKITDDEKPFGVPNGWKWARLQDVSSLITKGSSPKWQGIEYVEKGGGILFVTSENVGNYNLRLANLKYVEHKFNEIEPRSILEVGDILTNIVGASIGRTAVFDLDGVIANINQAVCLIRLVDICADELRAYLLHFLNSDLGLQLMFGNQVENARANLSMGNIAKFPIPLPPLAEQHRIVAKVDELMALCDTLKARLQDTQTTRAQLAGAVVEQAVA